jgi:23S rRNA (cytidine1920-2'-O)/16S rRNA (cytidine1409-2'-O)-methyltransferase
VAAGRVLVDGKPATKASGKVAAGAVLEVIVGDEDRWVGRAALKLLGALETLPVPVAGKLALDAGASTGGFTQVLLEAGAQRVIAADVGHDQLHPSLAQDPRVENREGTNLRYLTPDDIPGGVDLIVGDLSFISLRLLVGPLAGVLREDGHALLMVKPQFEVGRERLARTGVVTDPSARRVAVESVVAAAEQAGLVALGLGRSPLSGQDGNAEFFVHLVPGANVSTEVPERQSLLGAVDYG